MKRLTLFCAFLIPASSAFAALPEPDTVFYGRVVHLGGGEEYLLSSGELRWTVTPPATASNTPPFEATATLSKMNAGTMSYQLRVPSHLAVAGTVVGVLPGLAINTDPQTLPFKNTSIKLNGRLLRMADPAGLGFDPSSVTRGAFRRLDFIYDGQMPDADGDGLPDWWEEKYNTDKHNPDANGDPDGDGVVNRVEYIAGTDPSGSDQEPRLPEEILVSFPPGGKAIPVIRATDTDSQPSQLIYTLGNLPSGISVGVLNRSGVFESAASFTHADVQAGRVVISHDSTKPVPENPIISISLRDETAEHMAAASSVRLSIADAATLWEGWGLPTATRPASLPAIQDATRLGSASTLRTPSGPLALDSTLEPIVSEDLARLFLGTTSGDTLLGSAKDDIISARQGDTVRAGKGADRILLAGSSGNVSLIDFSIAENDVIDLRGLLQPVAGRRLSSYVQVSGTDMRIDANGDGSGFTDLTLSLTGATLPTDVADLWDAGALETGEITPQTTLFLATSGQASEEGLATATFNLRRRGDASAALTVPLAWAGTAVAGRDYSTLPSTATFAAGSKTTSFTLTPLADDERETTETILLTLTNSSSWVIAAGNATATMSLLDLPSRVWLEVAERTAYKDSLSPAQIIVRRSGPLSAPLTAQFTITGRATPAVDYRRLPSSVTFAVAQESVAVDVVPLSSATLGRGAEEVIVSVKSDTSYLMGRSPVARLIIVDRPRTMADWMTVRQITGDPVAFLKSDKDHDGVIGLAEFAFGRDPVNADLPHTTCKCEADGRFTIEFHRWPGAPELVYGLESSATLGHWSVVPSADCEEIETEILSDGRERVKMAIKSVGTTIFLRVAVSTNIE
jgi:Calx-beta domain/Bacterial TSP3 repeat